MFPSCTLHTPGRQPRTTYIPGADSSLECRAMQSTRISQEKSSVYFAVADDEASIERYICLLGGRGSDLGEVCAEAIRQSKGRIGLALHASTEQDGSVLGAEGINALLHLRTEMAHKALNRPCCGVAQGTDGTTFNLLTVGEVSDGQKLK